MGDFNKEICRLCLELTPSCECETINENKKEKLGFLQININFNISDYAVACNRCVERLQECFEFKSRIATFVGIDLKLEVENVCLENTQVCQLCMSVIKNEGLNYTTDCKDAVLLEDMIRSCLPETGLDTVHEPLICKHCLSSLKNYYELMKSCKEVEQRIEHFCQEVGRGTAVNLKDMLKFKDCGELGEPIIKKEVSDFEFVDVNVTKDGKSVEIASVKSEAVDVKDELDNGNQTSSLGNTGSSKREKDSRKSDSKGNKHFCSKCSYSSNRSNNIKNHNMRCHSTDKERRCVLCSFVTNNKLSLKDHMLTHKGPNKEYGCGECSYETNRKDNLATHLLKHKDKSEVAKYKCDLCPYKSIYRSAVKKHVELRHDSIKKLYTCTECQYNTKSQRSYRHHELMHEKAQATPKYKCAKCKFRTKYKRGLVKHMATHEDPDVEKCFKCDKCPYRAKWQKYLNNHMLIHSDCWYRCDQCDYSSGWKRNVQMHKRVQHKD